MTFISKFTTNKNGNNCHKYSVTDINILKISSSPSSSNSDIFTRLT